MGNRDSQCFLGSVMMQLSKRAQLRALVHQHPDWPYMKYAEMLGQNITTIRSALSVMGLSRKNYRPKMVEKPKPKLVEKPEPRKGMVASRAGPVQTGYTKLI